MHALIESRRRICIRTIEASRTWPIRQQVLWPDKALSFVRLEDDVSGKHFGLFVEEQLVSVVSVFINGKAAQFRKFATLVACQGQGYGSILLRHVFQEVLRSPIERIWCNARKDKVPFYQRFGLVTTGVEYEREGIEYMIMEKNLSQYEECHDE